MSSTQLRLSRLLASLHSFSLDIKLQHSIFALPFAFSALFITKTPWPTPSQFALVTICMVTARSFAMGLNRYADRSFDALNERTQRRQIPAGSLRPQEALLWIVVSAAVFIGAAYTLAPNIGLLAFPLLAVLAAYSFLKRWTIATHFYLGLCLGLSPLAVVIALGGTISESLILLCFGIMLWVAGFDLIYSLQDMTFDRSMALKSFPSLLGPKKTLWTSRICFIGFAMILTAIGWIGDFGFVYFIGCMIIFGILAIEHWLVRDAYHSGHSKNFNLAFFNANGWISIIFLSSTMLDVYLGRWP